jgi:thiamine biosynthesis protein ThiS
MQALAHKRERAAMRLLWEKIGSQMVKIVLNGEDREVAATTVTALIDEIGLDGRKVAVERNLEIVPRSQYLATALDDGDRLEIVHFVGGG